MDGTREEVEAAHDPRGWAQHLSKTGGRCLLLGAGVLRYQDVFVEILGDGGTARQVVPEALPIWWARTSCAAQTTALPALPG